MAGWVNQQGQQIIEFQRREIRDRTEQDYRQHGQTRHRHRHRMGLSVKGTISIFPN